MLAFVQKRTIYVMEPAQDHKPVDDGDTGPMTGGMGAYSPTPVVTSAILAQIERDIFVPIVDGMLREGIEYQGLPLCRPYAYAQRAEGVGIQLPVRRSGDSAADDAVADRSALR